MSSFPDLPALDSDRGIGESRTKELDSLVKPENDTRKPCGKPQGIIKFKKEFEPYPGFIDEFLRLLETFEEEELKIAFTPLLDLYNGQEDYSVVMANLENHTRKLYTILQNHPL